DLRELAVLVRAKGRGAQGRMVRLLSRLQADVLFVGRVVGTGVRRDSAVEYAKAIHRICRALADCMVESISADELRRCSADLKAASATFVSGRSPATSAVDALDFLMDTLGKDLHDFTRVLQGPR